MDFEDFAEAIRPENWTVEQWLHTSTFQAQLLEDGTLFLSGPALLKGFSLEATQALTRFLAARVELPPLSPPDDFEGFTATPGL